MRWPCLKKTRGLKDHEVHAWLQKLRPLNPHISDLNHIFKNPDLEQHLAAGRLPANMLVDITPRRLSKFDIHYWRGERPLCLSYLQNMEPMTREMFQEVGPEDTYMMARLIEALREKGASVGKQDIVRGIGYGTGGVCGLAASGEMSVATINALLQQMAADAVKKFGPKLAASKKGSHLARMAKFLRSHPNYQQVMRQSRELPGLLLPGARAKLLPPAATNVDVKTSGPLFSKRLFPAPPAHVQQPVHGPHRQATQRPHQAVPGPRPPRHLICAGSDRPLQRFRRFTGNENADFVRGGIRGRGRRFRY